MCHHPLSMRKKAIWRPQKPAIITTLTTRYLFLLALKSFYVLRKISPLSLSYENKNWLLTIINLPWPCDPQPASTSKHRRLVVTNSVESADLCSPTQSLDPLADVGTSSTSPHHHLTSPSSKNKNKFASSGEWIRRQRLHSCRLKYLARACNTFLHF